MNKIREYFVLTFLPTLNNSNLRTYKININLNINFKSLLLSILFIVACIFFNNNLAADGLKTDEKCFESMSAYDLKDLTIELYDQENYEEVFNCAFILMDRYDDAEGYGWLGYLYYWGEGTLVDLKKSYNFTKIAAEKGDEYAILDLGNLHYSGSNPEVEVDYEKAYDYVHESFYENENFDALDDIIPLLYYGIGTKKNYLESFRLLNKYELSDLSSYEKSFLAEHYIRGVGTKQNIEYGVSILESLVEDGYYFAEIALNELYGPNYKDKINRKVKSMYFYMKDRYQPVTFGYRGFEKQEELGELKKEETAMEAINYARDIVDAYKNNSNAMMTQEVCYALGSIGYLQTNFMVLPSNFNKKVYEYNELAWQKNCSDSSAANYVNSILWNNNDPNYSKALEICLNDIKNSAAATSCIGYIGYFYQEGYVYEKNLFNAYVLLEFEAQNTMTLLNQDIEWVNDRLNEIKTTLDKDEIRRANLVVDEININFEKIFPYLYNDVDKKFNDTLLVKESSEQGTDEEIIPEYQKEFLTTRSSEELEKVSTVKDIEPPKIDINENVNIEGNIATLKFKVTDDSNIEAVFIDDSPVQINESNNGIIEVNQPIYIGDKDKQVIITAYDKWGKNSSKSILLGKTQESFDINYGDYYALIIGNNNYKYLPKLNTAVNDAKVLSQILDKKYKFKEVILLTNASRKEILTELYSFKKRLSFKDNFLIYYAGHGEIDRQLNEGYWQPINAEPDMPTEWIDNNTIASIVSSIKSKHVLVIADSCYSGLLTRGSSSYDTEVYENKQIYLERMSNKKSRLIFASGGKEPVVDGGGGEHSIFAKSFIDILNDLTNEVTISDISKRITSYVVANSDQTPEYSPLPRTGHDGGEFIFVPKN